MPQEGYRVTALARPAYKVIREGVLLVIEDDDTFAAILRDLSREMGFRSLVAGTA